MFLTCSLPSATLLVRVAVPLVVRVTAFPAASAPSPTVPSIVTSFARNRACSLVTPEKMIVLPKAQISFSNVPARRTFPTPPGPPAHAAKKSSFAVPPKEISCASTHVSFVRVRPCGSLNPSVRISWTAWAGADNATRVSKTSTRLMPRDPLRRWAGEFPSPECEHLPPGSP